MWQVVFAHGGWVLAAIVLASVAGLGVVIERCWRLVPLRRRLADTWERCRGLLARQGAAAAHRELAGRDDPMARLLCRGLAHLPEGRERVREAAMEAAQREVAPIERGLGVLATVAQIAPLLGLLGTVAGLIEAFQAASVGEASAKSLAGGIFMALGTTAAGLAVAIPAWIAYNSLVGLSAGLVGQLEEAAGELPLLVGEA